MYNVGIIVGIMFFSLKLRIIVIIVVLRIFLWMLMLCVSVDGMLGFSEWFLRRFGFVWIDLEGVEVIMGCC